jgi:quercetin dioxygenase-like cupin family protein
MPAETVARPAEEGQAFWMLGGLYEIKVSSEETGGAMSVMLFTIPAGAGPPPHVHDCAELVHVLDGHARFHAGGQTYEAGPGAIFHFPEGTEETFEPLGDTPVKLLTVYTPGGSTASSARPASRRSAARCRRRPRRRPTSSGWRRSARGTA